MRPLFWAAVALCAEEAVALEASAGRPASGGALAFAIVLFAGVECAYWASARDIPAPQPLAVYARSLAPVLGAGVAGALFVAVLPRVASASGPALIVVGLGAAIALVFVLTLLVARAD